MAKKERLCVGQEDEEEIDKDRQLRKDKEKKKEIKTDSKRDMRKRRKKLRQTV